jgi:transglutaminase-like putative cysteine protease
MDLYNFLTETDYIDFSSESIRELSDRLFSGLDNDGQKIETAYQFVEKEIPHSSDIGADILTFKASDVLKRKTGICYAKSNLFAALLRGQGIPTGFCYQYLTLNDDNADDGYGVHCLNAVYYNGHFIKLDTRGNRQAVFSLTEPKLAFPVRKELGEYNIPGIFAYQGSEVIKTFARYKTRKEFFAGIPQEILDKPEINF